MVQSPLAGGLVIKALVNCTAGVRPHRAGVRLGHASSTARLSVTMTRGVLVIAVDPNDQFLAEGSTELGVRASTGGPQPETAHSGAAGPNNSPVGITANRNVDPGLITDPVLAGLSGEDNILHMLGLVWRLTTNPHRPGTEQALAPSHRPVFWCFIWTEAPINIGLGVVSHPMGIGVGHSGGFAGTGRGTGTGDGTGVGAGVGWGMEPGPVEENVGTAEGITPDVPVLVLVLVIIAYITTITTTITTATTIHASI